MVAPPSRGAMGSGSANAAAGLKEPAIEAFLEQLTALGCPWELNDHWAGDQVAVGICRPGDPGRLAYVSVWAQEPGA